LDKENDLRVNIGYANKDETGSYGVFGQAISPESAEVFFNSGVDSWKDNLEDLTADIYGQTWFYENSEVNFVWQQLLASITGLMVIEQVSEPKEVEISEFKEEWAEKKTNLSEEYYGETVELSWQLKASIGRKLLEEYELEDFPALNRSDVLEAGDSLFS